MAACFSKYLGVEVVEWVGVAIPRNGLVIKGVARTSEGRGGELHSVNHSKALELSFLN